MYNCGVILSDQVKSLDWQVRTAEKAGKVAKSVLEEVIDRVKGMKLSHGLPRRLER